MHNISKLPKSEPVVESVDFVADIEAFHEKFGLKYDGKPRQLPEDLFGFRLKFLREELAEYRVNAEKVQQLVLPIDGKSPYVVDCLADQLDALVDLVYVALGTAYLHGFDFREAWRRVHEANMAKVRAERAEDSKRGSTFDVIKPAGWIGPDHTDLVTDNAHRS